MNNNWAEVSCQLAQELQSEQAQRQARRRAQARFDWSPLRWWTPAITAGRTAPSVAQTGGQTELSSRSA
jgi:hypothetical protein